MLPNWRMSLEEPRLLSLCHRVIGQVFTVEARDLGRQKKIRLLTADRSHRRGLTLEQPTPGSLAA